MSKVEINATFLKQLGEAAMKYGTQNKFIPIAIEWAKHAEQTVLELQDELKNGQWVWADLSGYSVKEKPSNPNESCFTKVWLPNE